MNEIIKIEGLRKRFGDNEVLKGITTSVRQGEVVAIIGPSGCGKSTFLRSINLLEEPTEGKIYIDGMCVQLILNRRNNMTKMMKFFMI